MSSIPFISIIIPTYRDWQRLSYCIDALDKQTYPKKSFEVIIVNNDPKDQVPENYYLPENITVVPESISGSYAARNKGISLAKGEIFGFTDSDCIPHYDWLKNAVQFFEENLEYDRIGGKVELFFSGNQYTVAEAYEIVYAFRQDENVKNGRSVTANMFTKKAVLDKIGPFNQSMYSGGDFEWGKRATLNNFQIGYGSNVIVKHPARKELEQIIKKARRVVSGKKEIVESETSVLQKYINFAYEIRPPFNEFKHIFSRGKQLNFRLKLLVFFTRYNIRVTRAYEELRLVHGAKPVYDA
ncbi:glycosyltransferase [Adhaeribacter radiodurans]|uniref:Glycosyltransferase family 2 protein n=1 Tax=Adhaeribacter radiodurans TaxID=2745197 RepID=A0A7L7L3K0_9BACT|nr:glycosyltransferase family A protein [Adhaeribacter radiodurans]QMU27350.1 glycosyltransferase family 2 protein [Adhaeribacter radiodurans]